MNIYAKNINKQKNKLRILLHHCGQAGFIPETQRYFNIRKSVSVICHINQMKGGKVKIISMKKKPPKVFFFCFALGLDNLMLKFGGARDQE